MNKKCLFFFFLILSIFFSYWIVASYTPTPLPESSKPIHFYSNRTRDDLKKLLTYVAKKAKSSISLSAYTLNDAELMKILENRSDEGVVVSVYCDAKANTFPESFIQKIYPSTYRKTGIMHRKLYCFDDSLLLLGSANLTSTSLTMHDNLLIGIYAPGLGSQLLRSSKSTFSLTNQEGTIWLMPQCKEEALTTTLKLIHGAKSRIRLAMFTLTHPALLEALIQAHNRGVEVSCLLDSYSAEGASHLAYVKLTNAGIPIYCSNKEQLLHHKWAYFDHKTLLLGSANWTRAAFTTNEECLMHLFPLTKEQKHFMHQLWKNSLKDTVKSPKHSLHT